MGFAAGSKFSYCFEVITVINPKSTQTQMHCPAFLIFGCSLGLRQSSCRPGSFSFSLCLVFRTCELFLLLSCMISLSQLVLKSTSFRIKASPVSCKWCLSQNLQSLWSLQLQFPATVFCCPLSCQVALSSLQSYPSLYLMISSSLLPSQPLRCSSYLRNEVAAFSLSMAVAVEQTFGSI